MPESEALQVRAGAGNSKDNVLIKAPYMEEHLMDKAYACSGMEIFLHYIKNFEPNGMVRVRISLYEGPNLVRDGNDLPCEWYSKALHPDEAIEPVERNMEKLR